jgi:putative transposase
LFAKQRKNALENMEKSHRSQTPFGRVTAMLQKNKKMQINYWQTLQEGGYYHIYNRSNGKEFIFNRSEDKNEFLKRFTDLVVPYCDVLAYCLMGNHFHFVLYCKPLNDDLKQGISKENTAIARNFLEEEVDYNDFLVSQFARLFLGFSKYYNNKYERNGNLFQKKFKRIAQETVEKVASRICYVHHNPIHHDAASFYDGYEYSSFNAYLNKKTTKLAKQQRLSFFDNFFLDITTINTTVPFETGIFEISNFHDKSLENFLVYHALFHQEWLEKKKWSDIDALDE